MRNQVNRDINTAKQAYYKNAFNNCSGDQRKTWKTINELTSRKSNKTVINEIDYNGQKSENQADVTEMLNSIFTEIGPNLSSHVTEVVDSLEEFLSETDEYLRSSFVFRDSVNSYHLRNTENALAPPKPRTDYLKRGFSVSGAQLWNSLPLELRQATSLRDFKNKLSRHSFK